MRKFKIERKWDDGWKPVAFAESQSVQYCRGWLDAMDSLYPSRAYRIVKIQGARQIVVRETKGRVKPHVN